MRLNYVSVVKKHKYKKENEYCVIRARLDKTPPLLWFKQLQLLWFCSPRLRKLCIEPKINNNVILISLQEQSYIIEAIDVLKRLIDKVNASYIIKDNPFFSNAFKELTM